jgi:hypothetical protein
MPDIGAVFQAAMALERAPMLLSIMSIHMEAEQTFPTELFHKVEPTLGFEPRLPLINALSYGVLPLKPNGFVPLSSLLRSSQLHLFGGFTQLLF